MIATRHALAALVFSLAVVALAGCSESTSGPAVTDSERVHADTGQSSGVAAEDRDRLAGAPVSKNPAATEDKDARAGREADRTNANPERVMDVEIKNLSKDANIYIGGEPTDKGYRQIHERGVTAIVDLRNPTPVQQQSANEARRLGMGYVNLPIDPRKMPPEKANAFLDFMRAHEGKQVLIHCGSANRASGMYAVYLGAVKGLSTDEAIARAKGTGLKEPELERDVRHYLNARRQPPQP